MQIQSVDCDQFKTSCYNSAHNSGVSVVILLYTIEDVVTRKIFLENVDNLQSEIIAS